MLVDLHVHTSFTPGCKLDPTLALEKAEGVGLDGICFTDRNTWKGAAALHRLREQTDLAIFVGAEITTDHGHYLVFFPRPEEVPEPAEMFGAPGDGERWPVRKVIETVRERGGVAIAAHPYDRNLERPAGDFIFTLRGLAAIEGFAGTRKNNVNELAIEAADHLSLPCVGGSAAEGSYQEIGTAATLFRDPIRDEAALVAALRAGSVWAVAIGTPPKFVGDELALREREERRDERRDDRRGGYGGERRGGRDDRRGGGGHRRRGGRGGRGGGGRR
ncbi:PHP-associated domain-containing protein [Vulgatibacter sp.]|uniref:PHP-associated domain-containing protein n=1 Tax=Vulgatibacter sp. TaxID=1971226 RepID=UPI0035647EB0